ncbi:hypothetical protein FCI23_37390 [Actinacidiphila oryziradicis]|uniref:Uncharacterized protein n=1 Tax=Actinacidiphila oryziradicis TaxID=2571141 RepID=A0A4U0S2B7_9ACTN|nr:hypothetical protein FCI23_37390 [Actinacidiphila oryziradicis]
MPFPDSVPATGPRSARPAPASGCGRAGTLAVPERSRWLCWAGLVFFGLGVALYGLALARFDRREVRTGADDHWIAGGALSISAAVSGIDHRGRAKAAA